MRFGRMAAVAKTESPITFQQQIQDWQTRRWELEISWPPMTAAQAADLQAFIDALGGQLGTFLAGDPLATSPRGSAQGSPICNGATNISGANKLVSAAWIPNQSGVLLPRDYLQVQAAGAPQRLHRVMTQTPINTDGGGNATIDLFPPIRETLASGTTIVLLNTVGTFRMTQNRVVDEMDSKKQSPSGLKRWRLSSFALRYDGRLCRGSHFERGASGDLRFHRLRRQHNLRVERRWDGNAAWAFVGSTEYVSLWKCLCRAW